MKVIATIDMSNQPIINVATPQNPNDAVNKAYADAMKLGLDFKDSCLAATTAPITLSGLQVIDGYSVLQGDRVLVKDQTNQTQNGLFTASNTAWQRTIDANSTLTVTPGMFTFVEQGTINANGGFVLTTTGSITIGTTALTFVRFSGAGQIIAGNGLSKTGQQLDVVGTTNRIVSTLSGVDIASNYVGQTSIITLGTVATGTWQAATVGIAYGGTGAINVAGAKTNFGFMTRAATNVGNGIATVISFVHNLNSTDIVVALWEIAAKRLVSCDVAYTDANTISLTFTVAPTANQYRVVVIG